MGLAELVGSDLGTRRVSYGERDAMLYALAVGARAGELDLVFERNLKVLPTFALPLGLWVADAASAAGAFAPERSLHGSQRLVLHRPLPPSAEIEVSGRIDAVWDKGRAAVLDIVGESEFFTATYSIFLPGQGGWGGEPGPRAGVQPDNALGGTVDFRVADELAALYRLTGDRHLIHIDPTAARGAGFPRPILHGLCTLGIAAREIAGLVGAAPWELTSISARFSAPVLPGSTMTVRAGGSDPTWFTAAVGDTAVLTAGQATFG
jgi:acyl dehydratase